MDAFLRFYLPLFYISLIVLIFIVPSIRVYRKTGVNPFRFATSHNSTHDYVGNSMKLFIVLLFLVIIVHSAWPSVYEYFATFTYLERNILRWTGLILEHVALVGIMIAQKQMRLSWRIGIDYENKTNLVTTGLFSISRNPIFLFLLLGLVGLFLLLPNAITLAVLFAAYLVLNITMRMEEDFLAGQHGQEYLAYKKQVRRII